MPETPVQEETSSGRTRAKDFDPEQYRMTIGEHLDELRRRLILGLVGFAVAVFACMYFGDRIIVFFCAPLVRALRDRGINPQLYTLEVGGVFMTYLKISLIAGMAIAGPWLLYQLWLFIAAGLYPNERKTVTRYIPVSVGLLVAGMVFVYVAVLPMTVRILIDFGSDIGIPGETKVVDRPADSTPFIVPQFDGDPKDPRESEMWVNTHERKIKYHARGNTSDVIFGSGKLVSQLISLPEYMDLVVLTMVLFGLSFQLPLVILALAKVGIVEVATFKRSRRMVYFILAVVAAVVAPGDVVTTMMMLLVPLIGLYELGIVMAQWNQKKTEAGAE